MLAHLVWPEEKTHEDIPAGFADDVILHDTFVDFEPSLVVLEGGLFDAGGEWRAPRHLLEAVAMRGGTVLIADADANDMRQNKAPYRAAMQFLGTHASYGPDDVEQPVYGADREHFVVSQQQILCLPEKMTVADWLAPAFDGVDQILAVLPVLLMPFHDVAASGNAGSTGTLQMDLWVDYDTYFPFATVRQHGDGFVVLIGASVTYDGWESKGGQNIRWLANLVELLQRETRAEIDRRATLRRLQGAIDRARSLVAGLDEESAGDVFGRATTADIDTASEQALRQPGASAARRELERAFGDGWGRLSARCRDYLVSADISRENLEAFASTDPAIDFAGAVVSYSRALEVELVERLFEPFRSSGHSLPEEGPEPTIDGSLQRLRRFMAGGQAPALGEMARILKNLGARFDDPGNGFGVFLDEILVDREAFCQSFGKRLTKYVSKFRNAAAHVDRMPLDECLAARAFLLDEPTRLLGTLTDAFRSPD